MQLSNAFPRPQNVPAGIARHVHDLQTSNHGTKTPSPEVSRSTEPKRDMSPAVARSATRTQAGLKATITPNSRPSRFHSNNTKSGSKRYFDMSEMSTQPPSGRLYGSKSVLSFDRARPDDDSSVDSTESTASAPSRFPASQPQQSQQTPRRGQSTKYWPPEGPRLMAAIKTALNGPQRHAPPEYSTFGCRQAQHTPTTRHSAKQISTCKGCS